MLCVHETVGQAMLQCTSIHRNAIHSALYARAVLNAEELDVVGCGGTLSRTAGVAVSACRADAAVALDLCLVFNSSVNAYRRLDPHFEAPNQIRASAVDRGAMVRVPIGNHRSMRTEVRAVAPDANPYLALYGIFKTGIDGEISDAENLRAGGRYLPDNIQKAIDDFQASPWIAEILGADVQGRYAELKQAAANRSPRELGSIVKGSEVQFHHSVYNQSLWNLF